MDWVDAVQVGAGGITTLGGGGAIVFGLPRFLGDKWLQDWKGGIDAMLQGLNAVLRHRNYVLQRFDEFQIEAIAEC